MATDKLTRDVTRAVIGAVKKGFDCGAIECDVTVDGDVLSVAALPHFTRNYFVYDIDLRSLVVIRSEFDECDERNFDVYENGSSREDAEAHVEYCLETLDCVESKVQDVLDKIKG